MRITDFHTHAFPDAIAERAMAALLAETEDVVAYLDGRLSSLLRSMDRAGIERAVLCSIATKPAQFEKILAWSESIRCERVIPFPSVHPHDPEVRGQIARIAAAGFRGIKLHPYYQDFDIDDPRVFPIYEELSAHGLVLLCHTGFDVAFPRVPRADPRRIAAVMGRFPDLTFVAPHLGSWEDWEAVEAHLLGTPVYLDTSYSLHMMTPERARALLRRHPAERVLFGTDSPWRDQTEALAEIRRLEMGPDWERAVLEQNADRLLD